jgi:hypothetical protein
MLIEKRCYTCCTNVWVDERMVTFLHQIPMLVVVQRINDGYRLFHLTWGTEEKHPVRRFRSQCLYLSNYILLLLCLLDFFRCFYFFLCTSFLFCFSFIPFCVSPCFLSLRGDPKHLDCSIHAETHKCVWRLVSVRISGTSCVSHGNFLAKKGNKFDCINLHLDILFLTKAKTWTWFLLSYLSECGVRGREKGKLEWN